MVKSCEGVTSFDHTQDLNEEIVILFICCFIRLQCSHSIGFVRSHMAVLSKFSPTKNIKSKRSSE